MAKYLLAEDIDFNFYLLGISSHSHDYRLCWAINKSLDFQLERDEKEIVIRRANGELISFSLYHYFIEEFEVQIELISNKSENGYLVPELKQADYFLKIEDHYPESLSEIVEGLRKLPLVNMVFEIDVETLKSKQNLLFIND